MKKFSKLFITLLIALVCPFVVKAADGLSITSKSYDENRYEFRVSGNSNYSEVMVSLFDGDNLLSFKTVSSSNGSYSALFDITFEQDKTITIKVGDINSTDYKISTLDVKKSVTHLNNVLVDENDNELIIKGANAEFRDNDRFNLNIYSMDDINQMLEAVKGTDQEEEFTQGYNIIKLALGKNELLSYFEPNVMDDQDNRSDYSSHMGGFTLKVKVDKETFESFGDFRISVLNEETGLLGDPIDYSYDEENEFFVVNMDKIGILLAYYPVEDEEVSDSNNPHTSDTVGTCFVVFGLSLVGLIGCVSYFREQEI